MARLRLWLAITPATDRISLLTSASRISFSRSRGASAATEQADQPVTRSAEAPLSFKALGLPEELTAELDRQGRNAPFPIQALTISDALAGRDVCGKAQTGSGKTLAFGLPMIARTETARSRRPHALILVPTRELANQVAEELAPFAAARGLWLAAIYGGTPMGRQIKALRAGVDIAIGTPGRLNDLLEQGEMSVADVRFVVLDEADQMSDMGFLPQVERILKQIEKRPQTLLFSATLDGAVAALSRRYQREPVQHEVPTTVESTEVMDHRFIAVSREERLNVTAKLCGSADRSIVFVSTTHGADRLMEQLTAAGVECAAIHGRLSQNKRERVLSGFATGHIPVLIATNVAARGIHVDGVDLVVHYDPPEDTKVYLHRSGRTARAGNGGLVVTLALPEHEADIARLIQSVDEDQRIVLMDGEDPRLSDLASWQPPRAVGRVSGTYHIVTARPAARGGGGGGGAKRKPARAVAAAAPRSSGGRAARSRSRRPW